MCLPAQNEGNQNKSRCNASYRIARAVFNRLKTTAFKVHGNHYKDTYKIEQALSIIAGTYTTLIDLLNLHFHIAMMVVVRLNNNRIYMMFYNDDGVLVNDHSWVMLFYNYSCRLMFFNNHFCL